jgi:DNA-binding response OmpR family regulator
MFQETEPIKTVVKTILFVEDNPLVLASYSPWLERQGYNVESAGDGETAIEKFAQLKPDLVILDLMLPKMNGAEVLSFIRSHAELKDTPVLILSNAYLDEQVAKMTMSANKRLLKTQCTPAALIQDVRELLGSQPSANGESQNNEDSLKETRAGLLKDAPAEIAKIREHCRAYVRAGGAPAGAEHVNHLYQGVRFLCARSGLGDYSKIAHLASAIEAMLFEIIFKNAAPAASGLQTIAQAVDCLGHLFQDDQFQSAGAVFKARVLVVDDDAVCNHVTVSAMKRAKIDAVSTQDPVVALDMAQAERYDMVLLDVHMSVLTGFEVCEKLRLLSGYQKTPVIFVTASNELQTRAQAVLSGGSDLIAKPIAPLELALKTIMHLIEPEKQFRASRKVEAKMPAFVASDDTAIKIRNLQPVGETKLEIETPENFTERVPVKLMDFVPVIATGGTLDKLVVPFARILFADGDLSEIQLRSARLALEHHNMAAIINGHAPFDAIVRETARIIFGNAHISEMHLRLARIALERYNVPEIIGHSHETNYRNGHVNGAVGKF